MDFINQGSATAHIRNTFKYSSKKSKTGIPDLFNQVRMIEAENAVLEKSITNMEDYLDNISRYEYDSETRYDIRVAQEQIRDNNARLVSLWNQITEIQSRITPDMIHPYAKTL